MPKPKIAASAQSAIPIFPSKKPQWIEVPASQLFLDNRSQLATFAQQPLETRDRILPVLLCCAQVRKIIPEDMWQTGIDVQLGLNTIFLS